MSHKKIEYAQDYKVTRDGRVLSYKRNTFRELKTTINKDGYHMVHLSCDGKPLTRKIHILVLEAYDKPRPDGMVARHIDGNPSNNHITNLAWGTVAENNRDKIKHGTSGKGENNPRAILSKSQVLDIRDRCEDGEHVVIIAEEFGVSPATIRAVKSRKNWAWL